MHDEHNDNEALFFELLRYSLDESAGFRACPTARQWTYIYEQAVRQSLVALLFKGANRLREEQEPPFELMMQWASEAEDVRSLNQQLNGESKRFTKLFEKEGHNTVILKGQANARLYPDPMSRQPGDIDIYVDGGKEAVGALLKRLKLVSELKAFNHHFQMPETPEGIEVEVHFRYARGGWNKKQRTHLMNYLHTELAKGAPLCPEGFRIPPLSFALAMQLSHIQQHVMGGGIGLRQMVDYYILLTHASQQERCQLQQNISFLGLQYVAQALMWVLHEKLHLREDYLIAKPDPKRGAWMLHKAMTEGNFGFYREKNANSGRILRFLKSRKIIFRQMWMCPNETFGILKEEWNLWSHFLKTIPQRIQAGKLYLSKW